MTIGAFNGGNRFNIVPETVELLGTRARVQRRRAQGHPSPHPRHRDEDGGGGGRQRRDHLRHRLSGDHQRSGSDRADGADLKRVAGAENVRVGPLTGTAEDFSFYQQKVPGMFFFLGVTPKDRDIKTAPANHSPLFFADESALPVGVRAMANLALDYLFGGK